MRIKFLSRLSFGKHIGEKANRLVQIDCQYFMWLKTHTHHEFDSLLTNTIATNFCGTKIAGGTSVTLWRPPKRKTSYQGSYPCDIEIDDWFIFDEHTIRIEGNNHWYNISKGELGPKLNETFNNFPYKVGDSFSCNNGPVNIISNIRKNNFDTILEYYSKSGIACYSAYQENNHHLYKFFIKGESQKTITDDLLTTTHSGSRSTQCEANCERGASEPQYANSANLEEREFYYYQGAGPGYA
jgi:hypothetical protein